MTLFSSLRYRITLIISCIAGTLLAIVVWQSISSSYQLAEHQLATKEAVFSSFLEDICRNAILNGEYEILQVYLNKLRAQDPDIILIRAADYRGTVVSSTDPAELGKKFDNLPKGNPHEWVEMKVVNAEGELGSIAIHFSHAAIDQEYRNSLKASILTACVGLVLLITSGFFIGRLLTRRLEKLTLAARTIADGDLSASVSDTINDEIGDLSSSFNTMARRLEATIAQTLQLNEELEQRVNERTADLETANHLLKKARDAAEAASSAKGNFLANMSHEIRTPMNAIIGMTHLAQQTELNPKQHDYLRKISFAADSLLGIINDILDFSKIEAGRLEIENTDFLVDDLLEQLTCIVSPRVQEKKLEFLIELSPDLPPSLVGDPLRLGQVLLNLTSNAVKFTDSGEVVLAIRLLKQVDNRVTVSFTVRDTGIGIPTDVQSQLFQPFTQADASTTRTHGGTGLGLAICRQLVGLMGSEIHLESQPGVGSIFSFQVKLGIGSMTPHHVVVNGHDIRGKRILVIDDSQNSREIFQEQLKALHFRVSTAERVEQGLEELKKAAARDPYDLVIMDWLMPVIDGFEGARMIRSDATIIPQPKILMTTAFSFDMALERIKREELDGSIFKPVNIFALFDSIMGAFGKESGHIAPNTETPEGDFRLAAIRGARVLLVEDNEFNQQVATELLQSDGLSVTLAVNGQQALEQLQRSNFDIVFMDVQMPVMDGLEATRQLRRLVGLGTLPVIAMTAHALPQDRQRCLDAGMSDYIAKPIDPDNLTTLLTTWIEPRQFTVVVRNDDSPERSGRDKIPLPATLPGINVKTGLRMCNCNRSLYRDMLLKFRDTKRNDAEEIMAELENGDWDTACRRAHSMKSVAAILGADDLSTTAGLVEEAIVNNLDNQLHIRLASYSQSLQLVIDGLDASFGDMELQPDGQSG
jgi:signal transduction histidine kinase/CheY-like chemotaxis protein/HPt (histidine-containing phosphotransfer) domain-containing protein